MPAKRIKYPTEQNTLHQNLLDKKWSFNTSLLLPFLNCKLHSHEGTSTQVWDSFRVKILKTDISVRKYAFILLKIPTVSCPNDLCSGFLGLTVLGVCNLLGSSVSQQQRSEMADQCYSSEFHSAKFRAQSFIQQTRNRTPMRHEGLWPQRRGLNPCWLPTEPAQCNLG